MNLYDIEMIPPIKLLDGVKLATWDALSPVRYVALIRLQPVIGDAV